MPTTFRPYEPNQTLLLPPDLRDWLPPDHLAYDIADLVDTLDLAPFYAPYEGDGRRHCPYEPAMMVKILLYAYATGTCSSRTMARKLEADVAFRVLAAGNFPRHRTWCEFRRRHLADVAHRFREVVHLARELGLVELGALAIDGTKLRANASKRKAMSYGRMLREEQRLRIEIDARWRRPKPSMRPRTTASAPTGAALSGRASGSGGMIAWPRSGPPRRGSRPNSARRMTTAAADRDRSAIRGAGSRTRAATGHPTPRPRPISPTPRAR